MLPTSRLVEPTPSAYPYPLLIKQLLHTPMAHAPDREIVYRNSSRYTYRQFGQRIARLANVLQDSGVEPGQTVAVMDWDTHRYLESYFTIPMMGAVLMMVNVRLSNEQIAYTLQHSGAVTLLVNSDFLPVLNAIRAELPQLRRVIVMSDEDASGADEYEGLMARATPEYAFADFDENTRATTFYTTGTTGLPKGVSFSHRQIVLHTLAVHGALAASPVQQRFHRGDVYMPLTPMFHVHAWGLPYVATLMGVKQVYPGRYIPDLIVDTAVRERVTFSHGVPTVLQLVLAAAKGRTFHGWKMVTGGSALPAGLCEQALEHGIDVFTGYGMSETCPILTLAQVPAETPRSAETATRMKAGWPIPLVELRVVDEAMNDVWRDGEAVGEIVARAPWLTQAYVGNGDASEALWHGGYLHTQDIGRVDPDGALRIVDRLKDVIKTGGEWVSSIDLERLLSLHPGVAEVAVIGVPHQKWGERPVAVVVPKVGFADTLTEGELRLLVEDRAREGEVSKFAVPDRVHFVAAIDKTSVGKFDKKALRRRYAAADSMI